MGILPKPDLKSKSLKGSPPFLTKKKLNRKYAKIFQNTIFMETPLEMIFFYLKVSDKREAI